MLKVPDSDSFSIELWVRPAGIGWSYTILGFYVPGQPKQLLVRQWHDGLLVTHNANVDRDKTRTIKFDVDNVFRRGQLVLITICSGAAGTSVYVNGSLVQTTPSFRIARSEMPGQIILGNSPVTYHPWPGELHGMAVYSKELSSVDVVRHYQEWVRPTGHADLTGAIVRYAFKEGSGSPHNQVTGEPDLKIPASFSIPYKGHLTSALREFHPDWRYALDAGLNVAGFMPLGVVLCAYFSWTRRPWKAVLATTISCGLLSFAIEALQYYIPRRGSGTTDIITNTLGAFLGAALAATVVRPALERIKLSPQHGLPLSKVRE